MRTKVAQIDLTTGEIVAISQPVSPQYTPADGEIRGNRLFKHISPDSDNLEYIQTKWWDGERYRTKTPRPSEWFKFNQGKWELKKEELQEKFDRERKRRLARSDYTMLEDVNVNKNAWKAYRAQLRALAPGNAQALEHIPWPEEPE